jgi:pyruvate dehydrogenase E1 component beta subunit
MALITYREALNQALSEEIERDERVVLMGEEVAQFKGSYKVSEGMLEKFGDQRIIDTPISEAAFSGLAVGAAMMGMRPVVEFMFWSFCYVAFDQIFNNAANVRYMSGGLINVPIVFRGPANGGTNVGATHSHTPENFAANTPGLKVICPATAADAKGMMKSAIRDNDPVCVMENTILYNLKGEVPEDENFLVPLGKARVALEGKDISIISHGRSVHTSLQVAETLQEKHNISAEILDLRSIRPLDIDAILQTVKKTNRVLLVEENKPFCGVDAQIAYIIQEQAFDYLDAPIKRVSCIDTPQAYSKALENVQIPNHDRVLEKALEVLS